MDIFFKEWWDSGREDPEEFASLVQQYADAVRMIEREACAKVCRVLADGCDKSEWKDAAVMMEAYEYAEHEIRLRSNCEVSGAEPLAGEASVSTV